MKAFAVITGLIIWGGGFAGYAEEKVPAASAVTSLPENIQLITGMSEIKYYQPRVKAIHALNNDLPPEQIQALMDFLFQKIETQSLPDLEFNGLKNELIWVLIKQHQQPATLAVNLVKIYRDKSYDETLRDYCVQFFAKYYPHVSSESDRRLLRTELFAATRERHNRIAGGAGYMLAHMTQYPEFRQEQIQAAVFEALSDPECSAISKVSLLQAGAELGDKRILPIARAWAADSRNIALRMSAIGAIGLLGDSSDIEMLQKLSQSSDRRIQRPAFAAIAKIRQR